MSATLKIFTLIIFFFPCISHAESVLLERVPFKAQSPPGDWTANMNCGPTSVLMLAAYYKDFLPTTEDLRRQIDWLYEKRMIVPQSNAEYYDGNATNIYQLQRLLRDYYDFAETEVGVRGDWNYLQTELERGNPILVAVTIRMDVNLGGHFMVVVGLDEDEVILHDPGKTRGAFVRYSRNSFDSSWRIFNRSSLLVKKNPLQVSWHPDGTLVKVNGDSRVYILLDGQLHWITSEAVFNGHGFKWADIVVISEQEFSCYRIGDEIDWVPYRKIFSYNDRLYLMEKKSEKAFACAVYQFVSDLAFNSWNLAGEVRVVPSWEANLKYLLPCSDGGQLYLRHGFVVRPNFAVQGFGQGVIFLAGPSGILFPFDSWETYAALGFDKIPVQSVGQDEFVRSFVSFGEMITFAKTQTCLASGGTGLVPEPEIDEDGDGVTVSAGDCEPDDPEISPLHLEVCDNLDNDCNGEMDEGDLCGENADCVDGICREHNIAIDCTVRCPENMRAYVWFGANQSLSGNPVTLNTTADVLCERGSGWLDFNCACLEPSEWACFDWQVAEISCNQPVEIVAGRIDARGEGEVWFTGVCE